MNKSQILGPVACIAVALTACQVDVETPPPPPTAVERHALNVARMPEPAASAPVLTVVEPLFDDVMLGWGDGEGQVGLIPYAPERPPMGPMSIAVGPDATIWLLDPVNERLVALSASGGWLDELPCPPGAVDVAVGPDGRPAVLSIVNRTVTFVDGDDLGDAVTIPMGLRLVGGIELEASGDLLIENGYQQTFTLGRPGAWIAWPSLLHTQREGVRRRGSGPPRQVILRDGQAVLLTPVPGAREPVETILAQTQGAASVDLVASLAGGGAIVLLEWFSGDGVARTVQRVDADGRMIARAALPRSPLYYPFRELAVASDQDVLHLFPTGDGLRLRTIRLPGLEVAP